VTEPIEERFRRLLLLVPFVIRRPGISVEEVCEKFGITRAQLVRDLNLLFVCGLPGYGPGDLIEAYIDGGQVWIRMADYFSRPLRLTPAEGLLLYSGAKALAAVGVADESLEKALARLEEALGRDVLGRVSVELENASDLAAVREALTRRHRLHLVYYSHSKDEVTERDVDPWALFASGGRWYLVGWCHRVQDERIFRLDRIREVRILDLPSEVPADLDLTKYESIYVQGAGAIPVTVDVAPQAASWISEYYPLDSQETLNDGWIRIRLSAGGTAWLERLLLRLGSQARVVEPAELGQRVRDLACRLSARYRLSAESAPALGSEKR
jgi:proteasome accessory factor C